MGSDHRLIIVGAGPTGLTAAVKAAKAGLTPILVDRAPGPTVESRAVGVNRASLKRYEDLGIADRIIERGVTVKAARFFNGNKPLARLAIPQPRSGPPALVALPQSETEQILMQALAELGHAPRWNAQVEYVEQSETEVKATLQSGETITADWLLGADGSRSRVRKSLALDFDGTTYDGMWSLVDTRLEWPFPDEQVAVYFQDAGAILFVVTLGQDRYRIISNRPDAVEQLHERFTVRELIMSDTFTVSLRRLNRFGEGRIWIAGDAGHVHSPVGGMGMNLGIEDACDFVDTLNTYSGASDLAEYNRRRIAAAKRVLSISDRGYNFVSVKSPVLRVLRNASLQAISGIGFIRQNLSQLFFRTSD